MADTDDLRIEALQAELWAEWGCLALGPDPCPRTWRGMDTTPMPSGLGEAGAKGLPFRRARFADERGANRLATYVGF